MPGTVDGEERVKTDREDQQRRELARTVSAFMHNTVQGERGRENVGNVMEGSGLGTGIAGEDMWEVARRSRKCENGD